MSPSRTPRTGARLAIAGIVLHALAFALLHLLEPQLDVATSIISDYSQTESAWLAFLTFLLFAGIWASLAAGLSAVARGRPIIHAGRALFGLAVIGIVVGAVAPATADPRTGSTLARIQNLVTRPGLFVGVLLVSVGLLRAPGWSRVAPTLTGLAAVGFIILIGTVAFLLEVGLGGLGQRFVFLVLYAWVVVLSLRLASPTSDLQLGNRVRRETGAV